MFKKYKKELILSSLFTLLPILIGLLLWDKLPSKIATHWGVNNQPDGWSSKGIAVFALPLILVGLQWISLWITKLDPQMQKQNKKAFRIIFWIMPCVSIFASCAMYSVALGHSISVTSAPFVILGLMFIGIGNYLPKTTKNLSLGIKVIWTLNDEENWNATHRFAGKLWFIGGIVLMLGIFLPKDAALIFLLPVIFLMVAAPILYAYLYYKKQCREGRGYPLESPYKDPKTQKVYKWAVVVPVVILASVLGLMFLGEIHYEFGQTGFTAETSFYDDLTVEYDVIDSIEIRYESIPGSREWGYGSAKLLLGSFHNEEFGLYTRYTYTKADCAIVIRSNENVLVLSGADKEETEVIYEALLAKTGLGG